MKSLNIYDLLVKAVLICAVAFQFYLIHNLKSELALRPPVFAMDITAMALEAAPMGSTSEEMKEAVNKLTAAANSLSDAGYVVINTKAVIAAPAETIITKKDIEKIVESK